MLLMTSCCFGLSTVAKIVDPDNAGGTDYTSLDAWEDAFGGHTSGDGDLVGDDEIAQAECRSSGTDDTTVVIIEGWTVDSTRYPIITGGGTDGDFPADGIFDDSAYVLHNNDSDQNTFVWNNVNYGRIKELQFKITATGTNSRYGVLAANITGANELHIDSCIFKGVISSTGFCNAFISFDSDSIFFIYNTLIYDFRGSATNSMGVWMAGTVNLWNSTLENCGRAIFHQSGTCESKNTILSNNDDDILGDVGGDLTVDFNCDDDNDGTNNVSPNGPWTNEFTNLAGEDYSLKSGGNCVEAGTDDPGGADQTDVDIIRTARSSTWDIGAFELAAAPPAGGQVIIITGSVTLILMAGIWLNRKAA